MAEAYTVLARRYRSRDFGELVGQEPIAQTLKNAVATGRLAHAFLFTGTRGVGKTSSARILAKAINCPNVKDGQPCGTCNTCDAIARGEAIDVIEIDGASNNGVDQIRDLRQNAGVAPSHCPFKIYIIDEVHMLSTAAFNALLKTLEEPPAHVKFIFATTDVHKLPATILSRCQRYDFKNIPVAKITAHLKQICAGEKVLADDAALERVAILAQGSMRDALSLLDRVLSLGAPRVTEELLESLLGKPPLEAMSQIITAMAAQDAAKTLSLADAQLADGLSMERVLGDLIDFFRNILVVKACGAQTDLLAVPTEWRQGIAALAPNFDVPTLVHHIALAEQTMRSLQSSTLPRPLFDALLVRLALSEQFSNIGELLQQAGGMSAEDAAQKKNDAAGITAAAGLTARPPATATSLPPAQTTFSPNSLSAASPTPSRAVESVLTPARPNSAPTTAANTAIAHSAESLHEALCKRFADSYQFVAIGSHFRVQHVDLEAGTICLAVPQRLRASVEPLRAKVEQVLLEITARPLRIEYQFTDDAAMPPPKPSSTQAQQASRTLDPELLKQVRQNPAVQAILDKFGGAITGIEPLQPAEADGGHL